MGRPVTTDEMSLQPQVLVEPLEKWTLEFVGPINPLSRRKMHILVCIDYVTKWEEAKALPHAIEQSVVDFLFEDNFFCFGVLGEIVTDQGAPFTSKLVQ
jgi:hypothetical protein